MGKLMNKLTGKKNSAKEPCSPCDCECSKELYVPTKYRVEAVLSEKTFNKELNKYLFVNPYNDNIIVIDSKNFVFDVESSLYRITELLSQDIITEALIKRVN